jgi:hypothetical protein
MSDYQPTHKGALDRFLFDWFEADALGAVRLYFGLGLTLYLASQYPQLLLLDPFGPQFHYTIPIWYFEALGITHNVPLAIAPTYVVMLAACLFFALGKWTKPAIIVILVTMFYLKGVRDSFTGDVHHREVPVVALLALFLMSKCDRMFGVDSRRRALAPIEPWEASWPLRAMQIYVVMFYFWALMAKLRVSGLFWFEHGGRIQEMLITRALRDGFGPDGDVVNLSLAWQLAQNPDLVFVFGLVVFVFELFIPLILFVRDWRWRLVLLICATIFHTSNYLLLNVQFYLYPIVFVVFFNMASVHRWVAARLPTRSRISPAEPAAT